MYTEEDLGKLGLSVTNEAEDENQEKSVKWLLDMDLTEPEEKLFTVAEDEYSDEGLSDFEAEVASRPLVRGDANGDDLANYVDEEIVISSENTVGDIYSDQDDTLDDESEEEGTGVMAVDYSQERRGLRQRSTDSVDEGADILGLASDDDIGEKFVSIKRVKRGTATTQEAGAAHVAVDVAVAAVGGSGGVQEGSGHDLEIPEKDMLSDAPVPTQVAQPDSDEVANEGAESVANELQGKDTGDSVQDYVASMPEELDIEDDDAFDAYLLAGGDLQDVGSDPEELTLDLSEAEEEMDFSDDSEIDYHDDFLSLEGFTADIASVIAPVIGPVMEDISQAVAVRLASLGVESGAVTVDVRVGADEASVNECIAEGYQPAHVVCLQLPGQLQSLEQEAQDAVYVRLYNTALDANWNDLFSDDFVVTPIETLDLPEVEDLVPEVVEEEVGETVEQAADTDWSKDEGFGEDIFGDDFNEEFSAQLEAGATAEAEDIDEAFSDLSMFDEDEEEEQSVETPATEEPVVDEEAQAVESQMSEPVVEEFATPGELLESSEEQEEEDVQDVGDDEPVAEDILQPEISVSETEEESAVIEEDDDDDVETFVGTIVENPYPENFIPDYIEFNFTTQSNTEIFTDFLDAFLEEGSVEIEKLEHEVHEWEKDFGNENLVADVSRTLHTIKGIAKGVGLQRLGTLVHNFETLLEKMPTPTETEVQDYCRVVNAWLDAVVRGFEYVQEQREDIASELPAQPERAATPVEVDEPSEPEAFDETIAVEDEPVAIEEESVVDDAESVEAVETAQDELPVVDLPEPTETEVEVEALEELAQAEEEQPDAPEAPAVQVAAIQPRAMPRKRASALEKKRDKQLADEGAKVLAAQQSVRITSEKLDHLLNLTSQVQQLGVRASQNTSRGKRSSAELQARLSSVRTHIRKIADRALFNVNAQPGKSAPDLDALEMDQYSELQEAANILREGVEDLTDLVDVLMRQNGQVEALLKQQSSVISSISSSIQGARVVPVSRLMPGLRRIVRTVSTDLGKSVSFQVMNETGALDRDHYARLQVIMEHMVRNALDHGIELPDERIALGKPTGGRITIDVRKSGGDYVIRLADDGRGIDPDAIRQSALQKGLDIDVDALTDEEAMRLIFHKGFSTASTLSEISGRGVGMDIVMTELQQLGGNVQIESTIGQGTAFEVRIPSNVSVNGALLVAAGGESYAVPLNGLVSVEQVPVEEFFTAVEQHQTLSLTGLECEATYLATLCQGMPLPDRSVWSSFVPVIVAGTDDRYMAIAIDNLEEALELVVRSLGTQFSAVPGVAGAATTAEGEAIVALDLNLMVQSAGADGIAPLAVSQTQADAPLALVVDDSRTQRMVATSQLESVGMETITAENGLVAIDLLNATHRLPDVILLDVEMPVKDGIETLREIRKSSRYGDLPVIMVTSRTGAKHRALASEAGCNAYMGKPFNFAALTKQINELTGLELVVS